MNRRRELGLGEGWLHELPWQARPVGGPHRILAHAAVADELPDLLAAAYAVFRSARPRPVHIEIPIDVGEEKSEWAVARFIPFTSLPPAPAPAALDEAARLITAAKRLLIIAGGGAAGAAAEVARPRRVDRRSGDDDH